MYERTPFLYSYKSSTLICGKILENWKETEEYGARSGQPWTVKYVEGNEQVYFRYPGQQNNQKL
jgi:hypothetical protein